MFTWRINRGIELARYPLLSLYIHIDRCIDVIVQSTHTEQADAWYLDVAAEEAGDEDDDDAWVKHAVTFTGRYGSSSSNIMLHTQRREAA